MRHRALFWLTLSLVALSGTPGCAPQKCVCKCATTALATRPRPRPRTWPRAEDRGERYIAQLLRDKPFVAYKTKRIHLYYYKGSEAEKDRKLIVKKREAVLDRLEKFFGKKAPGAIRVFMFPSRKDARPYRVGTASPALRAYYSLYQKGHWSYEKHYPGHEMTHIFSNTDEQWRTVYLVGLLDEGLAEHFAGFALDPHARLTQHMQVAGKTRWYLRLRARHIDYRKMSVYEFGGSFVKFLIEKQPQGREKFVRLLRKTRLDSRGAKADFDKLKAALSRVYKKPFATLMRDWNSALTPYWSKKYPAAARPADRKALEQLAKQKNLGKIQRIFFFRFKWYLHLVAWLPGKRWAIFRTNADDQWSMLGRPIMRR